jgi:hypothetical protein
MTLIFLGKEEGCYQMPGWWGEYHTGPTDADQADRSQDNSCSISFTFFNDNSQRKLKPKKFKNKINTGLFGPRSLSSLKQELGIDNLTHRPGFSPFSKR